LLAALGAGCVGQLPPPTSADALRASAQWPGTTVEELASGRRLYVQRCSGCHALHRPSEKPPEAWPRYVREMTERSKLDEARAQAITRYLVVAAGAPR
jgi:mono/diheme cytochrome c family protein